MGNITERLIKGSDNIISLTLTEDGSAIASTATEIVIKLYQGHGLQSALTITRTPTGDGITFVSGLLEITPSDLTEDLSVLVHGRVYRAIITVKTVGEPDGVVFGGADSENKIYFHITQA